MLSSLGLNWPQASVGRTAAFFFSYFPRRAVYAIIVKGGVGAVLLLPDALRSPGVTLARVEDRRLDLHYQGSLRNPCTQR